MIIKSIRSEILKQKRSYTFVISLLLPFIVVVAYISSCLLLDINGDLGRYTLTAYCICIPLYISSLIESVYGCERNCQMFQEFKIGGQGRQHNIMVKYLLVNSIIFLQFFLIIVLPFAITQALPFMTIAIMTILFIPTNTLWLTIVAALSLKLSKWSTYFIGIIATILNCIFMTGNSPWFLFPNSWCVVINHLLYAYSENLFPLTDAMTFAIPFTLIGIIGFLGLIKGINEYQ